MFPALFGPEASRSSSNASASMGRDDSEEEVCADPEVKTEARTAASRRRRCRYACLQCRQRKVRCDGGQPCGLCIKQKRECTYPFKARIAAAQPTQPPIGPAPAVQTQVLQTPILSASSIASFQSVHDSSSSPEVRRSLKFRKSNRRFFLSFLLLSSDGLGSAEDGLFRAVNRVSVLCVTHSTSSCGSVALPRLQVDVEPIPLSVVAVGDRFGTKEMSYLNTFLKVSSNFFPLVSRDQVRSCLQLHSSAFEHLSRSERVRMNANLASTWAVAAIGGCLVDVDGGMQCLRTALEYLRDCFDMPLADSVNAYLAVCEACYRIGLDDASSWMKYVGFADVLEREVAPNAISPALRAILQFYHSLLTTNTQRRQSQSVTALPMVLSRKSVDPVTLNIEVVAAAYELTGRIIREKLDCVGDAMLRKQIDVTVMHLTAIAMTLASEATKPDSPLSVSYFMTNVFLVYFHVKLGRLREAAFCLREMVAVQEVCLWVLRSPRTVRCPFLWMQVMEKLQLWDARDATERQVRQLGLLYDGLVDESRVEEIMIVDMLRDLDAQLGSSAAAVPKLQLSQPDASESKLTDLLAIPSLAQLQLDQSPPPFALPPPHQSAHQHPHQPAHQQQSFAGFLDRSRPPSLLRVAVSSTRRFQEPTQVTPPSQITFGPDRPQTQAPKRRLSQDSMPSIKDEKGEKSHRRKRSATDPQRRRKQVEQPAVESLPFLYPDDTFDVQDAFDLDISTAVFEEFPEADGGSPTFDFDTLFTFLA